MRIIHYILSSYEDGDWSGVPRFDNELKKAIPNLLTITKKKIIPSNISNFLKFGDIIITDNGLCNDIPEQYKCIVVQHGLARTHKEREPSWAGDHYVIQQDLMSKRKKNFYVSTSNFMKQELYKKYNLNAKVILNSVENSKKLNNNNKKTVIGDWRDNNKGKYIIPKLKNRMPDIEFKQIDCSFYNKEKAYNNSDIYLCLSLSEGNSYSMLDALFYNIPVLSTDVGLFSHDYKDEYGIKFSYLERENLELIEYNIRKILNGNYNPLNKINEEIHFNKWKQEWKNTIIEAYYG